MTAPGPLADVRVLDVTRGGAGAVCTRILSQLGASVQHRAPAALGSAPELRPDLVVVDLRLRESGAEVLHSSRLGVGQALVSITPFGLDGPYAARADTDPASLGFGPTIASGLAGSHAALVGLAALRAARRTSSVQAAEVSTFEVMATCLGDLVPRAACLHQARPASAGRFTGQVTVLPCADGFVGLCAPSADDTALLAALTGIDDLPPLETAPDQRLADWLSHRTRDEVVAEAQAWRLPAMPVLSETEVWDDLASVVHGDGVAITGRPGTPFQITYGPSHSSVRLASRARERVRGPLADIRVLDLGMVWAGPYCGRLLASLGAEVIKVEGPQRRDGTRPPDDGLGCAGAFADLNQGKTSLVLNLSRSTGRDAFLSVAARADIVLDNFSSRVMPNFGLDYATLAQANHALLRLSLPAFRSGSPRANYVTYGSGLELATGLADPGPDGRPTPAPVPYLDYLTGTYGAISLVATLLARDQTGQGAYIEVAQHDVACQVRGAVLGRVRPPASVPPDANSLLRDPHLRSRGLFARGPLGDSHPHYARPPWRLGDDHQHPFAPAPAFGASTRQVLHEVGGLSSAAIERLIDEGTAVALVDGEVERAA